MCIHRNPRQQDRKTRRRRLTCRQRCMRRCRRWCCARIKRCVKIKVFGVPDPHLSDYELAGYNLGSIRSKIKLHKKTNELKRKQLKSSKLKISNHKIDLIEGMRTKDIRKKYSITISKEKLLVEMVQDYKKGNFSFSNLPNKSKHSSKTDQKQQMQDILNEYEKQQKKLKETAHVKVEDIKKKFGIKGSKEKVLEKMVDDYRKRKVSKSILSKNSQFDLNKLDKNKIKYMMQKYEVKQATKKKNALLTASKNKFKTIFEDLINNETIQSFYENIKRKGSSLLDFAKEKFK